MFQNFKVQSGIVKNLLIKIKVFHLINKNEFDI